MSTTHISLKIKVKTFLSSIVLHRTHMIMGDMKNIQYNKLFLKKKPLQNQKPLTNQFTSKI